MRHLIAISALFLAASCVSAPEGPPPAPPTRYVPPPPAPPPVAPASSDWRDWPLTPGDWSYGRAGPGTAARFGNRLSLACDPGTRRVTLTVDRPASAAPTLTVRTSSTARALTTTSGPNGAASVSLAGSDPILDAMGFSRGRFVIEQPGAAPLVVPAWAEILRVTEDCRG